MAETVADFMLSRLSQWGVRRIYGYPGDGINGILGALDRAMDRFQFVQVRHEEEAAFMATAHAKLTGEAGVCLATSGPVNPFFKRPIRRRARSSACARHCRPIGARGAWRRLHKRSTCIHSSRMSQAITCRPARPSADASSCRSRNAYRSFGALRDVPDRPKRRSRTQS